jgi:hypothetical protein
MELTPERIKYLRDWVNYFAYQFGQMADKVRAAQKLPPETEVHLGLFDVQIANDLFKVLDGYVSLEADAALGRAIRGMPNFKALARDGDRFYLCPSWATTAKGFDTPEQALGLKEGA